MVLTVKGKKVPAPRLFEDSLSELMKPIEESREILTKFGYFNLFPDIKWSLSEDRDTRFEDWWINPDFFDKRILDSAENNLLWSKCIEKLDQLKTH